MQGEPFSWHIRRCFVEFRHAITLKMIVLSGLSFMMIFVGSKVSSENAVEQLETAESYINPHIYDRHVRKWSTERKGSYILSTFTMQIVLVFLNPANYLSMKISFRL